MQILESLIAMLLSTDEYSTYDCVSCVASTRFSASRTGAPEISASFRVQRGA